MSLFIFIGRSGCGKGTQAKLLSEDLAHRFPERPIITIETGKLFREFAAQSGYTNNLSREALARGERLPDFLAVWNWVRVLVEKYTGEENIIIDGAPRSLLEAQALDTVGGFYPNLPVTVINLAISRETATARLLARRREDDSPADIEARLDWYDKVVEPAIEHFRHSPRVRLLEIDGEPAVEAIHEAIISQL